MNPTGVKPHRLELVIVSSIIVDPSVISLVRDVKESWFDSPAWRAAYRRCMEFGSACEPILVLESLEHDHVPPPPEYGGWAEALGDCFGSAVLDRWNAGGFVNALRNRWLERERKRIVG